MITRTEFVTTYARNNEISDEWATLGFIDFGNRMKVAMPCACGEKGCEGWAMLSPDSISHHLAFNAPEKLRSAYREALGNEVV